MTVQDAIAELMAGASLTLADMRAVMRSIMSGEASDAQISGLLVALAIKGESRDELVGGASVMRELAAAVSCPGLPLTDVVGTGGDGQSLFNVSTGSAFIAAAAGAHIAKHGNRSVTSKSGAADVLEQAGIRLDLDSKQVARCVQEVGIGFMFAVNHHSAMKYAIGPRKELKVRTIFNLLGPLTNPAGAEHGLVGVYDKKWLAVYAEAFRELGAKHILCVSSMDGLDELSVAAGNEVSELKNGTIQSYTLRPEDYDLAQPSLDAARVESAADSLAMIHAAYKGENKVAHSLLSLNGGAAIYAADLCSSIEQGISMAQDIMASGLAAQKIKELAEFTEYIHA